MSDPLIGSFRKPFAEQLAVFRLRLGNLVPTQAWDDLIRAEHDRAFVVAGAVKADLLADLAAAVDKAVSQGTTLETFRRDFRAIVEQRGWHGWTGEGTKKGEAWRTRVIYRTNLATSYAAGRRAQLEAGRYKFWVYRHGGSREPRIQHLAWDGIALPPDHPFWAKHAPPNGWGCTCRIFGARTEAGIRRVGGDPGKGLPEGWDAIDPKSGTPPGIDKGWDYAPGASVAETVAQVAPKIGNWDYSVAKAFMQSLDPGAVDLLSQAYRSLPSTRSAVEAFASRTLAQRGSGSPMEAEGPPMTLGLVPSGMALPIKKAVGLDVQGFDFALNRSSVLHVFSRHGDAAREQALGQRAIRASDFAWLLDALDDPRLVGPADDVGDGIRRFRLVARRDGERLVAIFQMSRRNRRILVWTMWVERAEGS